MNEVEPQLAWTPPVYDTTKPPTVLAHTQPAIDPQFSSNFARSSKWSPDGSVALTHCENRTLQLFTLPPELVESVLQPKVFHQPAPVVDYLWYPTATIRDPASFCFLASVRECPVKLLDATSGRLRASYSIVDHRERQIAPHSLAFNLSATKIYCGFEDAIEIFDVHRPGVDQGTRLFTTPSKKSKDGLKGTVSALAFCPDTSTDYFAAGTLTPSNFNIALLGESTAEKPLMWIGADGATSGVTQLKFNPVNPSILYASFRRRREIYSWDLRGDVSTPLQIFRPHVGENQQLTNQKMCFDVDLGGRWLATGDQRGHVTVFDTLANETDGCSPTLEYKAHSDAVGSVAFNPLQPVLLSVSGSRHFKQDSDDSSSDEDDDDAPSSLTITHPVISPIDRSIKTWRFGGNSGEIQS